LVEGAEPYELSNIGYYNGDYNGTRLFDTFSSVKLSRQRLLPLGIKPLENPDRLMLEEDGDLSSERWAII
jgi:hypothetical protein